MHALWGAFYLLLKLYFSAKNPKFKGPELRLVHSAGKIEP